MTEIGTCYDPRPQIPMEFEAPPVFDEYRIRQALDSLLQDTPELRAIVMTVQEMEEAGISGISQERADAHFSDDPAIAGSIPNRVVEGLPKNLSPVVTLSLPVHEGDKASRREGKLGLLGWVVERARIAREFVTGRRSIKEVIEHHVAVINDYARLTDVDILTTAETYGRAYNLSEQDMERLRAEVGRSVDQVSIIQFEHVVENSAGGYTQFPVSAPHHLWRHIQRTWGAEQLLDQLQITFDTDQYLELGIETEEMEVIMEMGRWAYIRNAAAVSVLQGNASLRASFSDRSIRRERAEIIAGFTGSDSLMIDLEESEEYLSPTSRQADIERLQQLTPEERRTLHTLCWMIAADEDGNEHFGTENLVSLSEESAIERLFELVIGDDDEDSYPYRLYGLRPAEDIVHDVVIQENTPPKLLFDAYDGTPLERLALVLHSRFDRLMPKGSPDRKTSLTEDELKQLAGEEHLVYGSMTEVQRREALLANVVTEKYLDGVLGPDATQAQRIEHMFGSPEAVRSPEALQGVEAAVEILFRAAVQGESVAFIGDCDTDGTAGLASALTTWEALTGKKASYRMQGKELGHSLILKDLIELALEGNSVINTIDTGSGAADAATLETFFKWVRGDTSLELYREIYGGELNGTQKAALDKYISGSWPVNGEAMSLLPGYKSFVEKGKCPDDVQIVIADHHTPSVKMVKFLREEEGTVVMVNPKWVEVGREDEFLAQMAESTNAEDEARIYREFMCYDQDLVGGMVVYKLAAGLDAKFPAIGIRGVFQGRDELVQRHVQRQLESLSIAADLSQLREQRTESLGRAISSRELRPEGMDPNVWNSLIEGAIEAMWLPEIYREAEGRVGEANLFSCSRLEKQYEFKRIARRIAQGLQKDVKLMDAEGKMRHVNYARSVHGGSTLRNLEYQLELKIRRHYREHGYSPTEIEDLGKRQPRQNGGSDILYRDKLAKARAKQLMEQNIETLISEGRISESDWLFYQSYERNPRQGTNAINFRKQALAFGAMAQIIDIGSVSSIKSPEARQLVREGLKVIQEERYEWETDKSGKQKKRTQSPGFYRWLIAAAMGRRLNTLHTGSRFAGWNAGPLLNFMHRSLPREVIQNTVIPFLTHRGESKKTRDARRWMKQVREDGFIRREKLNEQAMSKIERRGLDKGNVVFVEITPIGPNDPLYGFTGLIAGDIAQELEKPVCVYFKDEKTGKIRGSARLPHSGNKSFAAVFHGIARKNERDFRGGGHAEAAGYTMEKEFLHTFKGTVDEAFDGYEPELSYGGPIEIPRRTEYDTSDGFSETVVKSTSDWKVLETVAAWIMPYTLEPFGKDVDPPVFRLTEVEVRAIRPGTTKDGEEYYYLVLADYNGKEIELRNFEILQQLEEVRAGDIITVDVEARIIRRNKPHAKSKAKRFRRGREKPVVAHALKSASARPRIHLTNIVSNSRTTDI